MEKIRSGIAENLGHYVEIMCDVIISVVLSFIYGWKLALAIVFYIPLTLVVNSAVAHVSQFNFDLTNLKENTFSRTKYLCSKPSGELGNYFGLF